MENLHMLSDRVRFNRIQQELAQLGIDFHAEPDMCRCCVTTDYRDGRNEYLSVTDETPYLLNGYGMDSEWEFNSSGELMVNQWDDGYGAWSQMYLSHGRMTAQLWEQARAIFENYGFSLLMPESENRTAMLYA